MTTKFNKDTQSDRERDRQTERQRAFCVAQLTCVTYAAKQDAYSV